MAGSMFVNDVGGTMNRTVIKTVGIAAGLLLASLAGAASAEELEVTYVNVAAEVPTMTEWAMIGFSIALAAGAMLIIRQRGSARSLALGLAALLAVAVAVPGPSRAAALTLTLSGEGTDVLPLPSGAASHVVTITNGSSSTVEFVSFLTMNGTEYSLQSGGTCAQTLAAGASCEITLVGMST